MIDSVVTMPSRGRRIGRVTARKMCQTFAPSTVAASISSFGTWVRPAYRVMARNGRPCQTTVAVMNVQPRVEPAHQLFLGQSNPGSLAMGQVDPPEDPSTLHHKTYDETRFLV